MITFRPLTKDDRQLFTRASPIAEIAEVTVAIADHATSAFLLRDDYDHTFELIVWDTDGESLAVYVAPASSPLSLPITQDMIANWTQIV